MTDRLLSADDRRVRDSVREIVRAAIAPVAAHIDRSGEFPEAGIRRLADAGLAGLLVPKDHGGSGNSTLAYVAAMEEISSACGSTSTVYMTQMHAAYPILIGGRDEQRDRWLRPLCDGSALGSLCVTESDAGSDVAAMRTVARREGNDYLLSGAKTFITTGDRADVLVVFATVDRSAGRHGITAFLVEPSMPGFSTGRLLHKMGQRGSSTAEIYFDECRVPVSSRLREEGTGWELSMQSVMKSRLSAAAQGVGFARGAYEHALAWARGRDLLHGSRGRAQEVQFVLAETRARIAAARALLYATAAYVDLNPDAVTEVSMAKLHCTDCGMQVAKELVALLGEEGDHREIGIERFLRDVKVTQIYDGTNQIQRLLIARALRGTTPPGDTGRPS